MTTYSVLQARIADDLMRDDLSTRIKAAINNAITTWEGQRFAFNEQRYQILTVADQEYYDLEGPTLLTSAGAAVETGELLLELDDITVTVNGQPYRLTVRTQQWFNEHTLTTHTGPPCDYTIYGNQLRVSPVPDAVYTMDLMGLARLGPNPLTADGDTNGWMTEGEALIRWQAEYNLYRLPLRDAEGAKIAAEGIQEAEWQLKRKMAGKAFTGRQKAWSL